MSIRPTRKSGCNNSGSGCTGTTDSGIAIFQDSTASVLYARRLLANNVRVPIYLLNKGVNRTSTRNVTDTSFVPDHTKCVLQYMYSQQHRYVSYDNDTNNHIDYELTNSSSNSTDDTFPQNDRVVSFHTGSGPLGDLISSYYIPRVGPWFYEPNLNSTTRLENFIQASTMHTSLNSQEQLVSDRLSQIWNIPYTNSVVVRQPSILDGHYVFARTDSNGNIKRQLFLDQYHQVKNSVNVRSDINHFRFTQVNTTSNGTPIYDIDADGEIIPNVRLIWKTTPGKYQQTTAEGGAPSKDLDLPVLYRASIPISTSGSGNPGLTACTGDNGCSGNSGHTKCGCSSSSSNYSYNSSIKSSKCGCTGGFTGDCYGQTGYTGLSGTVNLDNLPDMGDLVTTHVAFSLPELGKSKNSTVSPIAWIVSAYTTPEDLYVTEPTGKYANSGYNFLIVEAFSLGNRRTTRYSDNQNQLQINQNHPSVETPHLVQFSHVVASVYHAYTGIKIPATSLLPTSSVCGNNGACTDSEYITDYSTRESPMETVTNMASALYGQPIFPSPNDATSC